ncbi:MAG: DUF3078 domain-containing protein [Candidatus Krumholzibacteria bacterium]|jgi:hypothetical protein|nr:DUF3078 domain-containing protein [Candidatus Krumholzibacteria bacterium]
MRSVKYGWLACVVAICCAIALLPATAVAEDSAEDSLEAAFNAGRWGKRASFGVNLLQSYYTRNWNGGDKGSVVWNATFDATAQKQLSPDWHWFNTANLAFGQNHQQDRRADGSLFWRRPDKSTDQIQLESLLRYTRGELDPFFSVRVSSQFLDQTDPLGRKFTFNPLEIFESAGISRMFYENGDRRLLARLGFTLRQSFRDQYRSAEVDAVGRPVDDTVLSESTTDGGLELTLNYDTRILQERVEYRSQLRVYKAVFYSGKSDVEDLDQQALLDVGLNADLADYFLAADIDFENSFKASITRLLNVQFNLRWVYDKYDTTVKPVVADAAIQNATAVQGAVRKSGQLRQTMSIGLAYTF